MLDFLVDPAGAATSTLFLDRLARIPQGFYTAMCHVPSGARGLSGADWGGPLAIRCCVRIGAAGPASFDVARTHEMYSVTSSFNTTQQHTTLVEDVVEIAFLRADNSLGFGIAGGVDHPVQVRHGRT